MDKYDPSQLTEFPRFEAETSQSGVSTFLNKFWKFPLFSPGEAAENMQNKALTDGKGQPQQPTDQQKQENEDKPETGSYAVEFEDRSLPNVLKRISSLVAMGSKGGIRYADTELARYWMPDDISRECYECAARFSTLRRRHHCRVCGQIFCSRCCSQRVPGQIFGCAGGLRVCNYCCNVVLSYLRENDMAGDISPDLRTLQENLQVKFPENRTSAPHSRENFSFAREHEERCETRAPKEALHEVFTQLVFTLPTHQHRYRLVRYNGVWRGCDILQWIMENTNNKTRAQATQVCQALLNGYMECCSELPQFADYALYKPIAPPPAPQRSDSPEERTRLVESVSSYCLDLNLGESSARLIKTAKSENKASPSSEEENPLLEQSEGSPNTETKNACAAIEESGSEHLKLLTRQCLAREGLSSTWLDVLYPLCRQAADIVAPDLFSNDIDPRNYIQVKKAPGGAPADSRVIHGVALTKNVAHRGMPQELTNPTVLLLDCSIAYQRVEGKLTSLEPVLMQEGEYLARCAARIAALQPNVVLVRGSVARAVQDSLRTRGVALARAVGVRALARAARCTGADVLTSIDARIGSPRLGTCSSFYVRNYGNTTLMVLENCAEPQQGCCLLLRGASLPELAKVKKVAKFMLLACYNWKLEKSFLTDIEAVLPEPGMTFGDEGDDKLGDSIDENAEKKEAIETESTAKITSVSESASKSDTPGDGNDENSNQTAIVSKSKNSSKVESYQVTPASKSNGSTTRAESDQDTPAPKSNRATYKTESDQGTTASKSNSSTTKAEIDQDTSAHKSSSATTKSEIEDPLQKAKPFARKTDSDRNLSSVVAIRDFSDPLRATQMSMEDEVFLPRETKLKADIQNDRWSTDDAVLSISPNVLIAAPYLETEGGRRCALRQYFRSPLLAPTARPAAPHTPRARRTLDTRPARPATRQELHPFARNPITGPFDDIELRASLAHYRAVGCWIDKTEHKVDCPQYKPCVIKKRPSKELESEHTTEREQTDPLDPLAPENHQRLSLLMYSFSDKSHNVPDFCVNPWIMTMEMYGRRDISLGAFLDKYCFSAENKCPSGGCQVPMNQHVRRFVHEDVCITITCNTIGHSSVDAVSEDQSKQIMFWSRCPLCGVSARATRLTRTSLALSLCAYLSLRARAPRYQRAGVCAHPAHAHAHYFATRLTTACFKYNKISTWDIELPPATISINYDTKAMRDTLINQLNELMLKGHETFSAITDGESEKDQQNFKQHMEQIHVALTSDTLQEHTTLAGVVRSLWNVSDRIIVGEKMLRDAQDKWSSPAKPGKPPPDIVEDRSDLDDSGTDSASNDNADVVQKDETDRGGTEEDEEKGDKKTVRQILSQLLSNNQPSNQSGMIISSGLLPVVVMAGEIGSVIAATLASVTYQRTLAGLYSNQNEQEETETTSSGREKTDGDKSKASKSSDHIEVLLKDGLLCRVYYAAQFHRLRHLLLCPLSANPHISDEFARPEPNVAEVERCCLEEAKEKVDNKTLCEVEEGFLRSLSHCVPWAARGGKSGSTFGKTSDDRYVLKEMSKPEWQQFLEFAPDYFNYVINCHQNKLPSLLARILGVYSVGGAGNGVLVIENILYARPALAKCFDLKGSSRHRLAPGDHPVLLDENLLQLRWDTQFYMQSHTAMVLWAGVERDTAFLANKCVMDYSLLLGLENNKLVVGIIDYIRTFTWDKKLEHYVKKNLGSGQPTILSPEQYKLRFGTAMRKYFMHCPSQWDHLTRGPAT